MHACLNVDEIVRLIASELVASGAKATAAILACCCKSFEDPVLDALWETQDRLRPLLKSFPEDVWNEGGCTSFKRLPTAAEWGRFRKYARRIRRLYDFGTLGVLSFEVFSALQPRIINNNLLPNLNSLSLWIIDKLFIPFVSLLLSPRTTDISLNFSESNNHKAMVASAVTALPTLCPNLQNISLFYLPGDPMITAAVSEMVLATNRNILQKFHPGSPLTEEASEVVHKLPNLRVLSVIIEKETSLSSASLPNLTELEITCDSGDVWSQLFHGATFGKLESVTFHYFQEIIGDFLGTFERVALSSSLHNTLSKLSLFTKLPWNPNYSSLLSFTQLVDLDIGFLCHDGCSSTVDDDIVINLSRAMPKLRELKLGEGPCEDSTTGVTVKGLVALALHCQGLWYLRIHFQVASLSVSPASPGVIHNAEPTGSWTDCALREIAVGEIVVPEESALTVALTLLYIFPRITTIFYDGEGWGKVEDAIHLSRRIVDCSRATLQTGR